jgi:hypothetical protein
VWAPTADQLWQDIIHDRVLPRSLLNGSINAHHIPGVTQNKPGNKPSNSEAEQQAAQENLANGLCA